MALALALALMLVLVLVLMLAGRAWLGASFWGCDPNTSRPHAGAAASGALLCLRCAVFRVTRITGYAGRRPVVRVGPCPRVLLLLLLSVVMRPGLECSGWLGCFDGCAELEDASVDAMWQRRAAEGANHVRQARLTLRCCNERQILRVLVWRLLSAALPPELAGHVFVARLDPVLQPNPVHRESVLRGSHSKYGALERGARLDCGQD